MNEIKPCPFCGGKMKPMNYGDGPTFYNDVIEMNSRGIGESIGGLYYCADCGLVKVVKR